MALAEEKEAPLEVPQREEEEEEDPSLNLPEVEEEEELTQSQNAEEETNERESRQSTPLSELSPPPDDDHDTEPATDSHPADVESSSSPKPHRTSPPKHPPSDDLVTPTTITPTPALLQDPKVVSILEVNVELLKCVFFSTIRFKFCRLRHRHH